MRETPQIKTIKGYAPAVSETSFSDWWELTKPRLSLMSVTTAVLGYFAAGPEVDYALFFSLCLGTTLAAFGCGVLNQWWERDADALMDRTSGRPIALRHGIGCHTARLAAADWLGRCRSGIQHHGMGVVRDPVCLAAAAFYGDFLDVPCRL